MFFLLLDIKEFMWEKNSIKISNKSSLHDLLLLNNIPEDLWVLGNQSILWVTIYIRVYCHKVASQRFYTLFDKYFHVNCFPFCLTSWCTDTFLLSLCEVCVNFLSNIVTLDIDIFCCWKSTDITFKQNVKFSLLIIFAQFSVYNITN